MNRRLFGEELKTQKVAQTEILSGYYENIIKYVRDNMSFADQQRGLTDEEIVGIGDDGTLQVKVKLSGNTSNLDEMISLHRAHLDSLKKKQGGVVN